ncbi:MAG: proton-conducting transporter membrane subunit [Trueperaceae bacterium]|nr:proton-conducting transporter membrane subunit [Trueperaceae bacterium]
MTPATPSFWPLVAVVAPLAGAVVAAFGPRIAARLRDAGLLAVATATTAVAAVLMRGTAQGTSYDILVLQMTTRAWLQLRVDPAGAAYGLTVSALWVLALVYALGYLRDDPRLARYLAFVMICLSCTLGVAYAGDLLTLLIFFELLSVLSYVLIVHEQTPAALAAGTKYIVYVLIGGSLILGGVLLTFYLAATSVFAPGGFLHAGMPRAYLVATFAAFVAGFGVKAALVPLHGWVPDAHPAAPPPFSALLSGVLVASGGFGLLRVLFGVFGPELLGTLGVLPWLAAASGVTIVVGGVLAIRQPDLKRRLAYSTISQMGYLALALALATPATVAAGLVHLTHHAFLKATLFFCAGVWIHLLGARTLSELRGAAARTPLVAAAFTLAALGMMGTPPLSGFVSKWWLGIAVLDADAPWALAVVLVGALLAAGYLLPVVYALYLGTSADETLTVRPTATRRRVPARLLVPTVIAAALTLVFGLASGASGFPLALARRAATVLFGGG